jgi:hypothetical protein
MYPGGPERCDPFVGTLCMPQGKYPLTDGADCYIERLQNSKKSSRLIITRHVLVQTSQVGALHT